MEATYEKADDEMIEPITVNKDFEASTQHQRRASVLSGEDDREWRRGSTQVPLLASPVVAPTLSPECIIVEDSEDEVEEYVWDPFAEQQQQWEQEQQQQHQQCPRSSEQEDLWQEMLRQAAAEEEDLWEQPEQDDYAQQQQQEQQQHQWEQQPQQQSPNDQQNQWGGPKHAVKGSFVSQEVRSTIRDGMLWHNQTLHITWSSGPAPQPEGGVRVWKGDAPKETGHHPAHIGGTGEL